jgi:hypothetical protein
MKAVAELVNEHPHWFKAMAKAVAKSPERGIGSPRNKGAYGLSQFLTGDSIARWKTPGRAYRAVSHGIRRAKEILSGFGINSVPWKVVANELGASRGPTRGNKLGQRFALQTLATITGVTVKNRVASFGLFKGFWYWGWLELEPGYRAFYQTKMEDGYSFESIPYPLQRVDDGVTLIYNTLPTIVGGHSVLEGITINPTSSQRSYERMLEDVCKMTLIVSPGGRTYHLNWHPSMLHKQPVKIEKINCPIYDLDHRERWPSEYTMYTPMSDDCVARTITRTGRYWQRFAIRVAQKAWAVQDLENNRVGVNLPTDCTVLVFTQDSVTAGNCQAGTAAFAEKHGWKKRHFVPADWLVNSTEPRARAAAKVALERYWRERRQDGCIRVAYN